ncbi:glycosyltransferase [Paenibacillus antri]|uniref:Glycosyltransferase n=1 Tax=Paenibacillus antri TaxID=2582848 RepID=A0A5R9GAI4_9BACL|nr:glycosyltransferase [Paenibacillus antri]TLS53472.1 glycosyltransferase [Paenibacillus antri]
MKRYEPHVFCGRRINRGELPHEHVAVDPTHRQLDARLGRGEFALIHARFGNSGIRMLPFRRKWRVPLVTSFHGCDAPGTARMRRRRGALKRLFAEGDCFTVPCEAMKSDLVRHGCPAEKIVVHYSGIDLERFAFKVREAPDDGTIRILYVGRLVEKKGAETLLRAFRHVHQVFPNARLTIVGEGKLKPRLKRLARRLRIWPYVEFLGALPHRAISKQLNEAHIFCLPSRKDRTGNVEGIPNALKEAMASGLPVVSTFHSGIPELIEDGVSGHLVPEDSVGALAGKLIHVVGRPDTWAKLGKNARARVEEDFDAIRQTEKLEKLFDAVIAGYERKERERRERPLFSVVIPTYNRERYIARAIRSVLNQTCDDYELIVVDDGSTDRTGKIVRSFGRQVRYIRQRNRGPSEARNAGIRAAKGRFIAFLDSDDRFLPKKLEENKSFLERHPDCKFLYSWYYDVRGGRKRLRKGKEYEDLDRFRYRLYRRDFTIRTSTAVVRRDCFDKIGLFHPKYRYSQDWDMWLRLATHYRGYCQRKPLALYRRHPRKPIPHVKRHRSIRRTARTLYRWDEATIASLRVKFDRGERPKQPQSAQPMFGAMFVTRRRPRP